MRRGITAYSAYVPFHRLAREEVSSFLGRSVATGTRCVAGYDEDSTTMAVEALRRLGGHDSTGPLWFATTRPAYLEKSNSSLVHRASGLDEARPAYDMVGSLRSGAGALRAALDSNGVAALSDVRIGLPESSDESTGADAAACLACGTEDLVAELIATESVTVEVLDRWRLPQVATVESWDERFSVEVLLPAVQQVVGSLMTTAGVTSVDHLVLSCANQRLTTAVAGRLGVAPSASLRTFGFAGAAHLGVALADALDRADSGQMILVLAIADGVDAFLFRTTELLAQRRQTASFAQQLSTGRRVSYADALTWRGLLNRQPPRRPDPQAPASPPSYRERDFKLGLVGGRCLDCGRVMLPVQRVCPGCGVTDRHEPVDVSRTPATIATLTADRLAFSLSPPVIMAVVDFDGGGRQLMEVTDADEHEVRIGSRVEPTFRRIATSEGIHNYFWKVRPVRSDHGE